MSKAKRQQSRAARRARSLLQSAPKTATAVPPPTVQFRRPHWLRRVGVVIGFLVAVLGFVATIVQIWGPVWPTVPDIHPRDAINGSSAILPFYVTNKSVLFDMDARFTCAINLFYFMDRNKMTGLIRDQAFTQGDRLVIKPGESVGLPCDPSKFVQIKSDGSLMFGFENGQHITSSPSGYSGPITILKVCLEIAGKYRMFFFDRQFISASFQWPAEPNQHQWSEGPLLFDDDQEKWIPPDSKAGGVWGLRKLLVKALDGKNKLAPNALRCDSVWSNQQTVQ